MPDTMILIAWLAVGTVFGAAYLWLIARTVAAIQPPGTARAALGWLALRLVLAAGVLTLSAMQGALPLLAVLGGFLVARTVAIRRAERA